VIGRDFAHVIHPDDADRVSASFLEAISTCREYTRGLRFRIIGKEGIVRWVELNSHMRFDKDGAYLREEGVLRDITDRMRAEEAFREEKAFSESMLDAVVDTVFVFDPTTGRPLRWNRAFREISGFTDEEIAGKKAPEDWYGEEDLKHAEAATERVLEEGRSTLEMALMTKNGRSIPTEYTGSLIRDVEGRPKYIIAVGRDITERKRADEAREKLIGELQDAFAKVKTLSGLIPICASCKKVRDDEGYWNQIETYIREHSEAQFSHGICPECARKLYPELFERGELDKGGKAEEEKEL
jgi:PAS domain S-box-containing protein